MARHRDVRNTDYSDDYDGYDDVYGHSVDDDFFISPSNSQFIYNRENSREQQRIGEFIQTEKDIQEEDETELIRELSDIDKAKLESCLDQLKATLTPLPLSRNELANIVIKHDFDVEQATDAILTSIKPAQAENQKDVTTSFLRQPPLKTNQLFNIPALKTTKFVVPKLGSKISEKGFTIPKINFGKTSSESAQKVNTLPQLLPNNLSKAFETKLDLYKTDTKTDEEVEEITTEIDNIKICKPSFEIDLSNALKAISSSDSVKSRTSIKLEEKFEIPYLDCDEISSKINVKNGLNCSFDVKNNLLKASLKNRKLASSFGKVLCRKYHAQIKYVIQKKTIKLDCFKFNTLSPDDAVAKHIRKF